MTSPILSYASAATRQFSRLTSGPEWRERFSGQARPARFAQVELALKTDANLANAHLLLGNLLQNASQVDRAIAEYREALRLNPNMGRAQVDLGTALAQKGDVNGAVKQLRRAANGPYPMVRARALEVLKAIGK